MNPRATFALKIFVAILIMILVYKVFSDMSTMYFSSSPSSDSSSKKTTPNLDIESCACAIKQPEQAPPSPPPLPPRKDYKGRCFLRFHKYIASKYETKWMNNVKEWQEYNHFCEVQSQQVTEIAVWLDTIQKLSQTNETKLPSSDPDFNVANQTFSKFVYEKVCDGQITELIEKWIEPLALSLRHPDFNTNCPTNGQKYLFERSYLFLDSIEGREDAERYVALDLGASTFLSGRGGSSQQFIHEKYLKKGIKFNKILLFEIEFSHTEDIFNQVPESWFPFYQYYNIPANPQKDSYQNPLNVLKSVATEDDFVTFKLDIDNGPVEKELVKQIVDDPQVSSLIDEFFFEHHVSWDHMVPYWGAHVPHHGTDAAATLEDSYKLLSKMRHLGIRSHGWI